MRLEQLARRGGLHRGLPGSELLRREAECERLGRSQVLVIGKDLVLLDQLGDELLASALDGLRTEGLESAHMVRECLEVEHLGVALGLHEVSESVRHLCLHCRGSGRARSSRGLCGRRRSALLLVWVLTRHLSLLDSIGNGDVLSARRQLLGRRLEERLHLRGRPLVACLFGLVFILFGVVDNLVDKSGVECFVAGIPLVTGAHDVSPAGDSSLSRTNSVDVSDVVTDTIQKIRSLSHLLCIAACIGSGVMDHDLSVASRHSRISRLKNEAGSRRGQPIDDGRDSRLVVLQGCVDRESIEHRSTGAVQVKFDLIGVDLIQECRKVLGTGSPVADLVVDIDLSCLALGFRIDNAEPVSTVGWRGSSHRERQEVDLGHGCHLT